MQVIALFRELDDRQGLTSSLATLTMRSITYQTDTMISAVETHIGNILSKLGYSARTQIAAWAAEKGLLKQDE